MADKILKQNKIPGREQLTRPEEIGALSKYLGKIKKVQDEHTKLDKRTVEVKGRNEKPYFPEIDKLGDYVEDVLKNANERKLKLDESIQDVPFPKKNNGEVSGLDNRVEVVNEDKSDGIKNLDETVQKILDAKKSVALDDSVVEITDDTKKKSLQLEDGLVRLVNLPEQEELDPSLVGLSANKSRREVSGLDKHVEELAVSGEIQSLDSSVTELGVDNEDLSLDSSTTELRVEQEVHSLDNNLVNLKAQDTIGNLEESVIGLTENTKRNEIENLGNTLIPRSTDHNFGTIEALGNYVDSLGLNAEEDEEETFLEEDEEGEEKSSDPLGNTVISLSPTNVEDIVDLGTYVDEIQVRDTVSVLNPEVERLSVNPITTILDKHLDRLSVENGVDKLGEEVLKVGDSYSIKEITDLNNELTTLYTKEQISDLNRSISTIKVEQIVNALREDSDVDELKVEELISDLVRDAALGLPFDQQITEIKKTLEEIKFLRDDNLAFGKVTDLFTRLSAKNPIFASWFSKISGTLSEFFYQPLVEGVPFSVRRNNYDLFAEKLEESLCIAEIALWESARKKKNDILGWDLKNGLLMNNDKYVITVPSHMSSSSGSTASTKFGTYLKALIVDDKESNFEAMNVSRARIEKKLDKAGVKGAERTRMLLLSLQAAQKSLDIAKKAVQAELGRLPGFSNENLLGTTRTIIQTVSNVKNSLSRIKETAKFSKTAALREAVASIADLAVGHLAIKNRPNANNNVISPRVQLPTENYDNGNNRVPTITADKKTAADVKLVEEGIETEPTFTFKLASASGKFINFQQNYLSSEGIQTTLLDLCKIEKTKLPSSFEELQTILRTSPYITTPGKFTNSRGSETNSQSLGASNYWEIFIEPFVDEGLNGGFSYLPAIEEINLINQKKHGVNTGYGGWIPFTGFDLSLKKLGTKTAPLFDGEIVYPIDMEQMNDLRITIADDMFSSWNWYFRTCAEVSVYSSVPHDKYYYDRTSLEYPIAPTYVDHTTHCIALYKNITFRIRIYIMTPQYSTLKSFDLLCVLKDFSESYSGEIDGGGKGDLSLSFCVVGENPDTYKDQDNIVEETFGNYMGLEDKFYVPKQEDGVTMTATTITREVSRRKMTDDEKKQREEEKKKREQTKNEVSDETEEKSEESSGSTSADTEAVDKTTPEVTIDNVVNNSNSFPTVTYDENGIGSIDPSQMWVKQKEPVYSGTLSAEAQKQMDEQKKQWENSILNTTPSTSTTANTAATTKLTTKPVTTPTWKTSPSIPSSTINTTANQTKPENIKVSSTVPKYVLSRKRLIGNFYEITYTDGTKQTVAVTLP